MNFVIYFILTNIAICLYGTVFLAMRTHAEIDRIYLGLIPDYKRDVIDLGFIPDYIYLRVKKSSIGRTTIWILLSIVYTVILYSTYNDKGIKMAIIGLVFGIFAAGRKSPYLEAVELFKIYYNK